MLVGVQAAVHAAPFTGPTSPYYIDSWSNKTIYEVQGASVTTSFQWAYGTIDSGPYYEGNLAVSNVVTTNGFGTAVGSLSVAGQYTSMGATTGIAHTAQATPGFTQEGQYDGTSSGKFNYTLQNTAVSGGTTFQENIIRTDLNWQNPTALFSVQLVPGTIQEYLGIAYDPVNNSLWTSGWQLSRLSDWSLTGTLLSSFNTDQIKLDALWFDPADGTLWAGVNNTNFLEQWSTDGRLLQSGRPNGLPADASYLAGDFSEIARTPEPVSLALIGIGLLGLVASRRRTFHIGPSYRVKQVHAMYGHGLRR